MIPKQLAKRPVDSRGYVIPYTVMVLNGVPLFRTPNISRVRECITDRLCGICGEPLHGWLTCIGAPSEIEQKVFSDPAMHEACSRYSLEACPFLANKNYNRRPVELPAGATLIDNPAKSFRPDKIGLAFFKKYEECRLAELVPGIKVAKFQRVEWF